MKKMRKKIINGVVKIPSALGSRGYLKFIPDKEYLSIMYRARFKDKLNWDNPQTFNQKLQWLKLYDRKPEYSRYVDKYEVRKHISKTIGEEYLIPLIGVYDKVEEVPWDELPNKFVLKCTHASGANIICLEKSTLDIKKSIKDLKKWMETNYYWFGREWPYKDVQPRIICEKFISDKNNSPDDFKVLCFNGKAKLLQVHIDRFGSHKQDFYDTNWNKTNISQGGTVSDLEYDRPKQLEEMIYLSEQLAANMYHARIDWFIVGHKLYFGEITFFDGSGFNSFDNEEHDYLIGSGLKLPI